MANIVSLDYNSGISNIASDSSLRRYMQYVKTAPYLTKEQEQKLAQDFYYNGNIKSAQKLVVSHLRYVVKIAVSYKNYGLPMQDLIAEGNIGIMQAVKKFDPRKGFRLATYAIWWIKASIQEYILRSWSLVKIPSGNDQKKLFFGLRKLKKKLGICLDKPLNPSQAQIISEKLQISNVREVNDMDSRFLEQDLSLNAKVSSEDDSKQEWQDKISSNDDSVEDDYVEYDEHQNRVHQLNQAIETNLNQREQDIIRCRYLKEPADTLDILSKKYGVSKERIRQIESNAYKKVREWLLASVPN